jgi:hypothetical protein
MLSLPTRVLPLTALVTDSWRNTAIRAGSFFDAGLQTGLFLLVRIWGAFRVSPILLSAVKRTTVVSGAGGSGASPGRPVLAIHTTF